MEDDGGEKEVQQEPKEADQVKPAEKNRDDEAEKAQKKQQVERNVQKEGSGTQQQAGGDANREQHVPVGGSSASAATSNSNQTGELLFRMLIHCCKKIRLNKVLYLKPPFFSNSN